MRLTKLTISSSFPETVGFLRKIRIPISGQSDEIVALLFTSQGRSPMSVEEINASRRDYQLPDWMGYYCIEGQPYATDGRFTVPVKYTGAFEEMLRQFKQLHFPERPLPIVCDRKEAVLNEPVLILIHHLDSGETYLEPFESGKMFLRLQSAHQKKGLA